MRAADTLGRAKVRAKRRVSMWLPVDMLDRLAGLGAPGMTGNLIAIFDAAAEAADLAGKRIPKKRARARQRAPERMTRRGETDNLC